MIPSSSPLSNSLELGLGGTLKLGDCLGCCEGGAPYGWLDPLVPGSSGLLGVKQSRPSGFGPPGQLYRFLSHSNGFERKARCACSEGKTCKIWFFMSSYNPLRISIFADTYTFTFAKLGGGRVGVGVGVGGENMFTYTPVGAVWSTQAANEFFPRTGILLKTKSLLGQLIHDSEFTYEKRKNVVITHT